MKNPALFFQIICGMFFSASACAQHIDAGPVNDTGTEQAIENIAGSNDEETDYTAILEDLEYYRENPIDLNIASKEDLERLGLLTDLQIANLQEYLVKHGPLLTIYEMQVIRGWDEKTVYRVFPFVTVRRSAAPRRTHTFADRFRYGKHEIVMRYAQIIEPQKGFAQGETYLGDPSQLFFRYRFTYRDKLSIGITAKKDRGEEFFYGSQLQGFDFYSGHAYIRDLGPFRKIVLGDYQVQFGQGLTCWSGFATGKSSVATHVRRFAKGIAPYTGSSPAMMNRGAAAEVKAGNFYISGFFSFRGRDGNPGRTDTTTGNPLDITSFSETGYHRTAAELQDRDIATELKAGGNVTYKGNKWNVGVTGVYTRYSLPLAAPGDAYDHFDFYGNENVNAGIDYNLLLGKYYLFGELSFSRNGGFAYMQGFQASLFPALSVCLVYREYSRNHQNEVNSAFGERGTAQNERGIYLGFDAAPFRRFHLSGYVDVFRFPWLRFGVNAPSYGTDLSLRLAFQPDRKMEIYLQARAGMKQENQAGSTAAIPMPVSVYKSSCRLHFAYRVSENLALKSRVEAVGMAEQGRSLRWGFVMYQDISYRLSEYPLAVSARVALFSTDDYDTRIYSYESDLPYNFSVPAYYYQGMRFYIQAGVEIFRGMDLGFRIAQTYYYGQQSIGTGADTIEGNTKTDVKVQLRYRFSIRARKKRVMPELPE